MTATTSILAAITSAKQVWTDGVNTFESKQELIDHVRKPLVLEALTAISGSNADVAAFLLSAKEAILSVFEIGGIKRVTKSEHAKLAKALEYVAETLKDDPKAAFLLDNIGAVKSSFKWPTQTRMKEDEIATAAKNSLLALEGVTEELAAWVLNSKEAILEAYKAGLPKQTINEAAAAGLARYQAQKRAEKAAAAGTSVDLTPVETTAAATADVDNEQF